ncbi:gTPase Era [Clostridium sp. CAG:762]|nr:gTPase Era [Clostridium sp. CAG:762]
MKSGFVGIIGRPNVGKSSLLNTIMGKKIAITSNKPQTTRNNIQGIYNDQETQMVFVDTPGIHKPKNKLGKLLNKEAYFSMNDTDVILFVVDISTPLGKGDKFIIDMLNEINKPVILVLNKIDRLPKEQILLKIAEYKDLYNFVEIVPISAIKKDNVDRLLDVIKKYLNDNMRYYDEGTYTNSSTEFIIAELIREKILNLTDEEIPHSITCVVEKIEYEKNIVNINGLIIVDRESLKKIIIGKQGTMIKEIGSLARNDIELLLGKKVYLELYVKVLPKWRDKDRYLQQLGFTEFNN